MSEETTTPTFYENRRKSRGQTPPATPDSWKQKFLKPILISCGVLTVVIICWIFWGITHVKAVKASVHGAVIDLCAGADGRMLELNVKPGDPVRKGQELARLDDKEVLAKVQSLEALLAMKESACAQAQLKLNIAKQASLAELELARAHVFGAQARFEGAQAGADVSGARLSEQLQRAEAEYGEAKAQMTIVKKGSRKEAIEASKARLEAAKAAGELSVLELKQTQQLFDQKIESDRNLEAAKTRVKTQATKVREAELELSQLISGATTEELEMSKQALAARGASLVLARTASQQRKTIDTDVKVQEAQLQEANAELKQALNGQAGVALAEAQVKSCAAELQAARADLASQKAVLAEMVLRSPVDGKVSRTVAEVGDLCRKGAVCAQVVDTGKGLWVECFVRERDSDHIRVGEKARVEIIRGSGDWITARVEAVGMTTSSLDPKGGAAATGTAPAVNAPEVVWVKLLPVKPMNGSLPGMSARATIRAR